MVQNKKWYRPELIVLARSKPEEAVLTHCKRIGFAGSTTPDEGQTGCDAGLGDGNCGNCQSRSGS